MWDGEGQFACIWRIGLVDKIKTQENILWKKWTISLKYNDIGCS